MTARRRATSDDAPADDTAAAARHARPLNLTPAALDAAIAAAVAEVLPALRAALRRHLAAALANTRNAP